MRVQDVIVADRHRRDLGDIDGLARSIQALGLLHPIVVRPDRTLIVGQRRLEAVKRLGWAEVPVTVAPSLSELSLLLRAEQDENTERKGFLPTEGAALARAIEQAFKPTAEAAEKAGKSKDGKAGGRGRRKNPRKSFPGVSDDGSGDTMSPKPPQDEAARAKSVGAKAAGFSRPTLAKIEAVVASGDKQLIEEMDRTGKVNGAHKKLLRKKAADAIHKEPPPLPSGPFRVIVADPPWKYQNRPDDPTHRASNPYPSMTIEEIAAMPVKDLAHKDAILWLWVTNSHLPEVWPIVTAWGFAYKTMLTWAKNKMGTGDWLRGKTEHCLMCTRGKPTVLLTNETTLLEAPNLKHSQKPEEFYALVERLCPGSKLELFSRRARKGWQSHGNEVS